MLQRCIKRQLVLVSVPAKIVGYSTAVYDMLCLLCDIALMRFHIELVTSTTQLVCSMVLQAETACMCGAIICTQTESIYVYLAKFGETVAVMVVRIAVAVIGIESYSV